MELLDKAAAAAIGAYCPYSKFAVGAAVELDSGEIFSGSNQECASYSLTICAERVALAAALSARPNGKVVRIAIFSPNTDHIEPCGACREYIMECARRCGTDIEVVTHHHTRSISTLLPWNFEL